MKFNIFPIFSSLQIKTSKKQDVTLKEIALIKNSFDFDLLISKNNDFFITILNEIISEIFILITIINELLIELDLMCHLKTVIGLLILHYVFSHFKILMTNKKFRVLAEFRSKINSLEDFKKIEDESLSIANFILVLLFQFLVDVINKEINASHNDQNNNLINIAAIISNTERSDSIEFNEQINSLIYDKVKAQHDNVKVNNFIETFIQKNVII